MLSPPILIDIWISAKLTNLGAGPFCNLITKIVQSLHSHIICRAATTLKGCLPLRGTERVRQTANSDL